MTNDDKKKNNIRNYDLLPQSEYALPSIHSNYSHERDTNLSIYHTFVDMIGEETSNLTFRSVEVEREMA